MLLYREILFHSLLLLIAFWMLGNLERSHDKYTMNLEHESMIKRKEIPISS